MMLFKRRLSSPALCRLFKVGSVMAAAVVVSRIESSLSSMSANLLMAGGAAFGAFTAATFGSLAAGAGTRSAAAAAIGASRCGTPPGNDRRGGGRTLGCACGGNGSLAFHWASTSAPNTAQPACQLNPICPPASGPLNLPDPLTPVLLNSVTPRPNGVVTPPANWLRVWVLGVSPKKAVVVEAVPQP